MFAAVVLLGFLLDELLAVVLVLLLRFLIDVARIA